MFFLIDRFNFLEKHTIKWKEKKNNYKKKKTNKQTNKQTNKKPRKNEKNSTMLEQFQNPENLKVSKY